MPTNDPTPGSGTVPVPTPENVKHHDGTTPRLGEGPLDEHIRARAHEIWEAEGRPEGKDLEHWKTAAAEVKAKTAK